MVGAAFGDTLDVLWKVLKKTVFTIGSALAPLLTEVAEGFMRVVVNISNWIKENKDLVVMVFKIAAAAIAAGGELIVLGTAISGVGAALGAISVPGKLPPHAPQGLSAPEPCPLATSKVKAATRPLGIGPTTRHRGSQNSRWPRHFVS
jgi:hypothetical protein